MHWPLNGAALYKLASRKKRKADSTIARLVQSRRKHARAQRCGAASGRVCPSSCRVASEGCRATGTLCCCVQTQCRWYAWTHLLQRRPKSIRAVARVAQRGAARAPSVAHGFALPRRVLTAKTPSVLLRTNACQLVALSDQPSFLPPRALSLHLCARYTVAVSLGTLLVSSVLAHPFASSL